MPAVHVRKQQKDDASRLSRYRTVALEPEQQVGSAVAATGFPINRSCANAAYSARPRGKNLGSKGIQVDIEHCRRRQYIHRASEIQLLGIAQRAFDTVGN